MNLPGDSQAPLLLSPREAAHALRLSERALWSLTAPRGPIPILKIGRSVRYPIDGLKQYVNEHTSREG
jgi:hypothetical protein